MTASRNEAPSPPTDGTGVRGRRALVTGATGFIGSHVARRLTASGWEVHAVLRPGSSLERLPAPARVHHHDGTTEGMVALMGAAAPDVVFHLASLFIAEHKTADVTRLVESNLLFGAQLAEAMRVQGRSLLVNTGTVWQHYGDELYNPSCLYAATKQAFVDLLRFFEEAAGLRTITLELCESYGPDDPRPKLVGVLRRAAVEGIRLSLTDGRQEMDLVHVDDIARAFELAAERLLAGVVDAQERYVVRTGAPVTIRRLVELFEQAAGRKLEADWGARGYRAREVMHPWVDGETLPGWRPEIDLAEGIRALLAQTPASAR